MRFKFKATAPAVLYAPTQVALPHPMTPLHAARLLVARPSGCRH